MIYLSTFFFRRLLTTLCRFHTGYLYFLLTTNVEEIQKMSQATLDHDTSFTSSTIDLCESDIPPPPTKSDFSDNVNDPPPGPDVLGIYTGPEADAVLSGSHARWQKQFDARKLQNRESFRPTCSNWKAS